MQILYHQYRVLTGYNRYNNNNIPMFILNIT